MSAFTGSHEFRSLRCSGCGSVLVVPVYCGDRFCSLCSKSRRLRIRRRLEYLIDQVSRRPGYSLKHLTLTVPNCKSAVVGASEITAAFRRLRQRKFWKRGVSGGAFVLETTGSPGDWHVHLHAIIDSMYLDWSKLHELWQEVSTGRGVYIQRIPARAVVNYLLKYLTKTDVSPEFRAELADSFAGKRLFQPFGTWHSIPPPTTAHPCVCRICGGDVWLPESMIDSNLRVLRKMRMGRLPTEYPARRFGGLPAV